MTSLWMKLFAGPIGIALSAWLFTGMEFAVWYQPVVVGLIWAAVGLLIDFLSLRRGTLWLTLLLDFVVAVPLVYLVTLFFEGALVSFLGALETGMLLVIIEYFVHSYLIRTGEAMEIS